MTDYNDGKWHGWNGGERPVHPNSKVRFEMRDGEVHTLIAGDLVWENRFGDSDIMHFRVVKAYREPRERWAYGDHMYDTEAGAISFRKLVADDYPGKGYENTPITHWIEVL